MNLSYQRVQVQSILGRHIIHNDVLCKKDLIVRTSMNYEYVKEHLGLKNIY